MTVQQVITLSPRRLAQITITHLTSSQQRAGNAVLLPRQFMTIQSHQLSHLFFSHSHKNHSFSSTSHLKSVNSPSAPRCPTCASEIKKDFNRTTHMEEKCKCSNCKSFLPTQLVIKTKNDQTHSQIEKELGQDSFSKSHENLIDYFKLFEIDKKFLGLDFLKLKKSYHLWQQMVHPDFIQHNSSPKHSENSSLKFMKVWSALINRAKDVLTGDLTRAEYLIELHGNIKLANETDSLNDMGLLMEIMEAREQLEAAKTQQEMESIQLANQQSIHRVLNSLNEKFEKLIHTPHSLGNDQIDQLKELIIKLRYLENIKKIISSNHLSHT